jgi:cytochrome c-type biogenesis protein CcmH/NrfG
MKRTILATLAGVTVGAVCGVAIQLKRDSKQPAIELNTGSVADPTAIARGGPVQSDAQTLAKRSLPPEHPVKARDHSSGSEGSSPSAIALSTPADFGPASQLSFRQALESVASPQTSHAQKQAAWKQLRESGKLDQAIGELEQQAANDPRVAEYSAALGQAYLQKCATIQDTREQGLLALKADQVFDAAMNLDPNNWEARFSNTFTLATDGVRGTAIEVRVPLIT